MNTLELLSSLEGCKVVKREDGVIEIIPDVSANQFKNGDFLYMDEMISIFRCCENGNCVKHATFMLDSDSLHYGLWSKVSTIKDHRLATEEEKQLLLDALHKERKIWNPETLQIEEDRAPRIGDKCVFWDEGRNTVIVSVLKDGYKGDEGQMIYETFYGSQHLECVRLQDFDFETMSAKHEK